MVGLRPAIVVGNKKLLIRLDTSEHIWVTVCCALMGRKMESLLRLG